MKKIFFMFIVIMLFLVKQNELKAMECSSLIEEALEVYSYQISEINDNGDVVIDVVINNITENNYVVVENDYNNEVVTYHYNNSVDGIITIHSPNIYKKISYTIKVYLVDKTCSNDEIKTLKVTTDMFNKISGYNVCDTNVFIERCTPFYDIEGIDEDKFIKEIEEEINELNKTSFERVMEFVNKYYLFVLIPIVMIVVVYAIRIIILKRSGKNE